MTIKVDEEITIGYIAEIPWIDTPLFSIGRRRFVMKKAVVKEIIEKDHHDMFVLYVDGIFFRTVGTSELKKMLEAADPQIFTKQITSTTI